MFFRKLDSAKNYQNLAGPYLNVDFRVLMPTICYSKECHLRIAFFLIPYSDKGSSEQILINYHLQYVFFNLKSLNPNMFNKLELLNFKSIDFLGFDFLIRFRFN